MKSDRSIVVIRGSFAWRRRAEARPSCRKKGALAEKSGRRRPSSQTELLSSEAHDPPLGEREREREGIEARVRSFARDERAVFVGRENHGPRSAARRIPRFSIAHRGRRPGTRRINSAASLDRNRWKSRTWMRPSSPLRLFDLGDGGPVPSLVIARPRNEGHD